MLKKLANGEYSLKITFWIFGILGIFLFNILINMTHNSVLRLVCSRGVVCVKSIMFYALSNLVAVFLNNGHLLVNIGIHFFMSTIFIVYAYILLRGLWKSAASYSGSAFWSFGAKLVIFCLVLISLKSVI